MTKPRLIIDGHLDIALNSLVYERDQRLTVDEIRQREKNGVHDARGRCTTSFHELRAANCGLITATAVARCKPWIDPSREIARENGDFPDPSMAYSMARGQYAYYELMAEMGEMRLITNQQQLELHLHAWENDANYEAIGTLLMLEGADPVVEPSQLQHWYDLGVRALTLAHYGHSRYAAGTPSKTEPDQPLSDLGRELLREMDRLGVTLDLTHTSDQSLTEALDLFAGPVYSSHTNARAVANAPRQMADQHMKAIIDRDGILGLVTHFAFIKTGNEGPYGSFPPYDSVTFEDWADHVDHICQLAGDTLHIGIGSDLDGAYGADRCPVELEYHRDMHKLADVLLKRGYSEDDMDNLYHANWLRFWRHVLPEN